MIATLAPGLYVGSTGRLPGNGDTGGMLVELRKSQIEFYHQLAPDYDRQVNAEAIEENCSRAFREASSCWTGRGFGR